MSRSELVMAERIGLVSVLTVGDSITVTKGGFKIGRLKIVTLYTRGPQTQLEESGVPTGKWSLVVSW